MTKLALGASREIADGKVPLNASGKNMGLVWELALSARTQRE